MSIPTGSFPPPPSNLPNQADPRSADAKSKQAASKPAETDKKVEMEANDRFTRSAKVTQNITFSFLSFQDQSAAARASKHLSGFTAKWAELAQKAGVLFNKNEPGAAKDALNLRLQGYDIIADKIMTAKERKELSALERGGASTDTLRNFRVDIVNAFFESCNLAKDLNDDRSSNLFRALSIDFKKQLETKEGPSKALSEALKICVDYDVRFSEFNHLKQALGLFSSTPGCYLKASFPIFKALIDKICLCAPALYDESEYAKVRRRGFSEELAKEYALSLAGDLAKKPKAEKINSVLFDLEIADIIKKFNEKDNLEHINIVSEFILVNGVSGIIPSIYMGIGGHADIKGWLIVSIKRRSLISSWGTPQSLVGALAKTVEGNPKRQEKLYEYVKDKIESELKQNLEHEIKRTVENFPTLSAEFFDEESTKSAAVEQSDNKQLHQSLTKLFNDPPPFQIQSLLHGKKPSTLHQYLDVQTDAMFRYIRLPKVHSLIHGIEYTIFPKVEQYLKNEILNILKEKQEELVKQNPVDRLFIEQYFHDMRTMLTQKLAMYP